MEETPRYTETQMEKKNRQHMQEHQRKVLGVLCALLAPSCLLFGLLGGNNYEHWYYSISATYYANSKMCMIGLLFATAVFFVSYRGYDVMDRVLSILSALFALGVVAFPCRVPGGPARTGIFYLPMEVSHIIHLACAACLFLTFAVMILFQFTKGSSDTPKKRKRNTIYRVCGIGIFVVLVWQVIAFLTGMPGYLVIIDEFIMLLLFSCAWLVKGNTFKCLND